MLPSMEAILMALATHGVQVLIIRPVCRPPPRCQWQLAPGRVGFGACHVSWVSFCWWVPPCGSGFVLICQGPCVPNEKPCCLRGASRAS